MTRGWFAFQLCIAALTYWWGSVIADRLHTGLVDLADQLHYALAL